MTKSPFRVDLVDQFQGHHEYGYAIIGYFDTLEEAIKEARKITEEGIKEFPTIDTWHGMGDAGLVYDSQRELVWDGIKVYTKTRRNNLPQSKETV